MSRITLIIATLILVLTISASGILSATTVVVIAHKDVPADSISRNELRDIFLGDIRQWNNGERIVVVDTKPRNDTKDVFYDYIGKSPSRMKSVWIKKLLTGEGDPPEVVESDTEAIRKIAATPGAIGFVTKGTQNDSVKVLAEISDDED